MAKIPLILMMCFAVMACVRQPSKFVHELYASDFETSQVSDNPFQGWESRINHGYELQPGTGRQGDGLAMNLMASQDAKAVMVSGNLAIAAFLDRNGQAYPDGLSPDVVSNDALQTAYDILDQQPGCGL